MFLSNNQPQHDVFLPARSKKILCSTRTTVFFSFAFSCVFFLTERKNKKKLYKFCNNEYTNEVQVSIAAVALSPGCLEKARDFFFGLIHHQFCK